MSSSKKIRKRTFIGQKSLIVKQSSSIAMDELAIKNYLDSQEYKEISSYINGSSTIEDKIKYLSSTRNIILKCHESIVTGLALTPDSNTLLSCSKDKSIKVWNIAKKKPIIEITNDFEVNQILISPDNEHFFTLSGNKVITQWNLDGFNKVNELDNDSYLISCIAITKDSKEIYIATGFLQNQTSCLIRVWNIEKHAETDMYSGHTAAANCMIFTDDNKYMVSCSGGQYVAVEDNSVRLWNINSRKNTKLYNNFNDFVNCIVLVNKKYLLCGSKDRTIQMLDLDLNKIYVFRGVDSVKALAVMPSQEFFISGGLDSSLKIWDLDKKWVSFEIVSSPIYSVACNSKRIFAGLDRRIVYWDVLTHNEYEMTGHNHKINYMQVPKGSNYLVTADSGGVTQIKLWNLMTGIEEKNLGCNSGFSNIIVSNDGRGLLLEFPGGGYSCYTIRTHPKKVIHSKSFEFILMSQKKIKLK
jgi:WD40 repeat protein